ncbi:hypothetical protein [Haliscomenobacter hydrossis]|uniref:Uncharacterized protein n=1 Tax=Haliscomenobacter hydrossis (strain ATCC 27775 / DSM 1100 / LMG 10767 / O) TaxID=760192 RepID=F4L879_HALH1|nr:hypothetical protein [Haliscomenobacter hydrossis]AEE54587.1 hypothetical protein Halhy_6774 [Haliscomenobacter hydrossis DSM 1100]
MAKKSFAGALSGERKSRLSGIVSPQLEVVKEKVEETPLVEITVVADQVDPTKEFPLIPEEAMEELRQKAAKYVQDGQGELKEESKTVIEEALEPKAETAPKEKARSSTRKEAEPKEGAREKMNLFIETGYEFGIRVRAAAASEMMDLREFVETALTHYMNEVIGNNVVNKAVGKYKERNNLK